MAGSIVDRKHQQTSISEISQPEICAPEQGRLFHDPEDLVLHHNLGDQNRTCSPVATTGSAITPSTLSFLKGYKPSRQFLSKCQSEQDCLLESIKTVYHSEIKSIYDNPLYPDLNLHIGQDFKKALNKCIIFSRAFKLYHILKKFSSNDGIVEKDIIVSQFQTLSTGTSEKEQDSQIQSSNSNNHFDEVTRILDCTIPDELITPELLLNFLRRVFTHDDISFEELEIIKPFINWLQLNRPELIHTQTKQIRLETSRESFRTIAQDFDQLTVTASESEERITTNENPMNPNEDKMNTSDAQGDGQPCSLTRTETFELLTKSNPDSPSIVTSSKNSQISDERADASTELSNDDSTSQSSYAPTTRTGLRPKTFTTPVGLSSSKKAPRSNEGKKTDVTHESSTPSKAKKAVTLKTTKTDSSQHRIKPASSQDAPDAKPRSTIISASKNSTTAIASKSPKVAAITRAHPISMERSQSPATTNIKNPPRNFIAANKRVVSQSKDKNKQSENPDSEADPTDSNFFMMRQVTSDSIIAQLDEFTLVSQSKLIDSLSKIFVDGILTDTVLLVKDEKHINAHKCILAARSPYFAEVISKQTQSLEGESLSVPRIDLKKFSHTSVYFATMHIYTGLVRVFDDVDVDELAELTNILHVKTLKQVCIHNLKMNYCHFFHKPCNVCCLGVLKALPLAWRYDYTDLYSRCLQWIGSHFSNVFCLKEFSELTPNDLIEECYSATLAQLTPDNVIPKTIECQRLLKSLPRVKWTEPIICLVGRQLEDFCNYVADNYEKILQSDSFLNLAKNCWECEILEENLLAAMNNLKPDSGCKTLIQLHKIECSIESGFDDPQNLSDSFSNLVSKMRKYCERYLLKDAAAVVHCNSWRQMNPSLQKRIKDQAILSTDFDDPSKQLGGKPKLPSMTRATSHGSQSSNTGSHGGGRSPSNRSTPESRLKSPNTMYLPQPKSKAAAARHVKVLK